MLYALGVVLFVLAMLASIALHEIGHLVPRSGPGVKVTQYMVGFGPPCGRRAAARRSTASRPSRSAATSA
jgi:membrane-associated protease RseP (regulator of RpoE activity)